MYDEAIMLRFIAYCRAHPEWFTESYLNTVEAMVALDDPAAAQEAWEMLLARFVEEVPDGGTGQDRPSGPTGWKPRFV